MRKRSIALAVVIGAAFLVMAPLAYFGALSVMMIFGDQQYGRMLGLSDAYLAAADGALLDHDKGRADRLQRDFSSMDGRSQRTEYAPCALSDAEIAAGFHMSRGNGLSRCDVSAGPDASDVACPFGRCVQIVVNAATLEDADAKAALLAGLRSRTASCAYARAYGVNPTFDAGWLGCSDHRAPTITVLLVGVERVAHPCILTIFALRDHYAGESRGVCAPHTKAVVRAL